MDQFEHFFTCPYCWENISILVDTSVTNQSFIEDCEVCCRPIEIHYEITDGEINQFSAKNSDE